MVGVAVNVTLLPVQIDDPGFAEILTLTGNTAFTTIVIAFDVAGAPVTQSALLVIIQVIISPFASVLDV